MNDKITLVLYRHKVHKDIYLVRNWNVVGGNATTDFYQATKNAMGAISNVMSGIERGERFDSWMNKFLNENNETLLVAKMKDIKEFEFDGYKGIASKELVLRCADFERVELTERGE